MDSKEISDESVPHSLEIEQVIIQNDENLGSQSGVRPCFKARSPYKSPSVLETCNMFFMEERNSQMLKDPLSIDVTPEARAFLKEEIEFNCNEDEVTGCDAGVILYRYKCFHCHEKCQGKVELLKHLCETHKDIPLVYDTFPFEFKCYFCSRRCISKEDFHKHVVESHYPIIGSSFKNTSNPSCEVKLLQHAPNYPASTLGTFYKKGQNQWLMPNHNYIRSRQKKSQLSTSISNCSNQNTEEPEEVTNKDSSPRIFRDLTNYFYICYHCNGRSSCKKDLELHIIQTHVPYLGNINAMPPVMNYQPRVLGVQPKSQTKSKKAPLHQCSYCAYSSSRQCFVRQHEFAKHTFEKPFHCKLCDYRSSSKGSIQGHMKAKHAEKQFKCNQCDYRASHPCKLKYHQQAKHSDLKNYNCSYCDYRAAHPGAIRRHVSNHHRKLPTFHCPYCEYNTRYTNAMGIHVAAKHTKERPFRCQECSYSSVTSSGLKLHMMRNHSLECPFPCKHCSFKAVSATSLKNHLKSKHMPPKKYSCEHCDYTSSRLLTLRKHIQAIHLGEKPFQCYHCGYSSAWLGNLKIHIRSLHNKDPWHKCQYCFFKSLDRNGLKSHMQKKHYYKGALKSGLKPKCGPGRPPQGR